MLSGTQHELWGHSGVGVEETRPEIVISSDLLRHDKGSWERGAEITHSSELVRVLTHNKSSGGGLCGCTFGPGGRGPGSLTFLEAGGSGSVVIIGVETSLWTTLLEKELWAEMRFLLSSLWIFLPRFSLASCAIHFTYFTSFPAWALWGGPGPSEKATGRV